MTDDRKDDWWWMSGNRTMGPRPELIAEFQNHTKARILFYQPHKFLEYAKTLGETVSAAAIAETKVRKEESLSERAFAQSGAAWLDLLSSLDARVATLTRDVANAEREVNLERAMAKVLGSAHPQQRLLYLEADLQAKKEQLAVVHAELRAMSAVDRKNG